MPIRDLVDSYIQKGYGLRDAQNLAAEEIVIKKIASSDMVEHVTLKGGIVMYNLAKNNRRVTQDIDFDLIRYSIDKKSIKLFITKMNNVVEEYRILMEGDIEDLHQEDYKGVRVHILIKDKTKNVLKIKLDIGVHTYFAIDQEHLIFNFDANNENVSIKVNPAEQIMAEKLLSLSRLGIISTRYKDLYDFYYLIKVQNVSSKKVREILELFLSNSTKKPNNITELQNSIEDTLNDRLFLKEASKPASKWVDEEIDIVKDTILDFINKL